MIYQIPLMVLRVHLKSYVNQVLHYNWYSNQVIRIAVGREYSYNRCHNSSRMGDIRLWPKCAGTRNSNCVQKWERWQWMWSFVFYAFWHGCPSESCIAISGCTGSLRNDIASSRERTRCSWQNRSSTSKRTSKLFSICFTNTYPILTSVENNHSHAFHKHGYTQTNLYQPPSLNVSSDAQEKVNQ